MIRRSLYKGLLLLPGLLLTLHTLVPHVHGGESVSSSIPAADVPGERSLSVKDLLGKLIESDLGEDHLEHFELDKDFTEKVSYSSTFGLLSGPTFAEQLRLSSTIAIPKKSFSRNYWLPPAGIYPEQEAPRGPPVLT